MTLSEFDVTPESLPGSFHSLAYRVYRDDDLWAPLSENEVERFAAGLSGSRKASVRGFLVSSNGEPRARGISIHREESGGSIGFFEALPDSGDAVKALFDACRSHLSDRGASTILAPKVDNQLVGLQVDGFHLPQTVLTGHHPPWYREYFEAYGFRKAGTMHCFAMSRESIMRKRIDLPGYRVRSLRPDVIENEIRVFHELQNEIFGGQAGYRRRSIDESRQLITGLLPLIDPQFVLICERRSDASPVGVLICVPDRYQEAREGRIDRLRVLSIGVVRRHRLGVGAMLASHMVERAIAHGYREGEASWIHSTNAASLNLARRFNVEPGRTFALYRLDLPTLN